MRKEHPFDFEKWNQYLTGVAGHRVVWKSVDDSSMEHPQYDPQMYELAKAFEWSDYYDRNYDRTLRQHDHRELSEDQLEELARTSDNFRDLRAVVSVIIHGESRLEGMWAAMLEKGILLRLLVRLEKLTPGDFPEQY
ncbi:hypothetical protein WOSG25_012010 [Weissella oryzae SG25]|uniref:Uncharacterized protein n=2 Tax=Weissella TaxID=46255 RepID=A0A069CRS4_WEIOS|nr:hypothetical protein WOSG25_012010 [Weissella oryzae SG25]